MRTLFFQKFITLLLHGEISKSFCSKEQYLSYLNMDSGFHFLYKEVAQSFMPPEIEIRLMFLQM